MTRATAMRRAPATQPGPRLPPSRRTWSRVVAPHRRQQFKDVGTALVAGLIGLAIFFGLVWGGYYVDVMLNRTAPCELEADPAAACRATMPEIFR